MKKYYLAAPGPTPVPEMVLLEMAKPIIHHRTKTFEKVMAQAREGLKWIFQTKEEVLMLASAGSGAMEAALANTLSPGDTIVAIRSGKFGERWSEIAKGLGLRVIDFDVEWGKAVNPKDIRGLLERHPEVKAVLCQACETSTGVIHPVEELVKTTRASDVLMMVDAITALGIVDLPMDKWSIDVMVTGSQKAFMLPPGLSMIALSPKAWEANASAKCTRYYFDLKKELEAHKKNQTNFTPAISLIQGLNKSLEMMKEETLEGIFTRHARLAAATQAAVKAWGLELLAPEAPSNSLTAVRCPSGVDGEKLVQHMQDKYGVTIIGGQDKLKGKIFRLGHMGYCGDFDVITMLSATEMTLKDLDAKIELGRGVAAALQVLHQGGF